MKILAAILFAAIVVGCATAPDGQNESFVVAPNSIDQRIGTATIEDYILALPPFEFHEETEDQFAERVLNSRRTERKNTGKDRDALFVSGDGCWPAKDFVLVRSSHMLRIHVYSGDGDPPYDLTMQRVPGGWKRGSTVDVRNAEQLMDVNRPAAFQSHSKLAAVTR